MTSLISARLKFSQDETFSAAAWLPSKVSANLSAMGKKVVSRLKKRALVENHLREWREYRSYTQPELAELAGVSTATISQLETGEQGFSDRSLHALAQVLYCSPGELLSRNPLDDEVLWPIWNRIPNEVKPQALRTLRSFAKEEAA